MSKKTGATMEILPIGDQIVRFLVILVIAWILSYSTMSANPKWAVETYVPWSFWLLHYLIMFGIVGGWPLTAPFGDYGKAYWRGHRRILLGLTMTGLVIGISTALSAFFANVYPGYPLFPGGAWFGICLFYISLWWVFNIQTLPRPLIPSHSSPPVNIAINSLIIILLSVMIFQIMDFEGPAHDDPSNPHGPILAGYVFGQLVSITVWVQCFASNMVFQGFSGSPLENLPYPFLPILLLVMSLGLGVATYQLVIAAGVDQAFYAEAVGTSQICGSLFHTVAFDFWPYHKIRQPLRGLYSFVLSQVIFPFFWIWLCRTMLAPIYDLMVAADPLYSEEFTEHTLIHWFSLHVVTPLLLIHQFFFMRWPFRPAGPMLGPMDVGIARPMNVRVVIQDRDHDSGLVKVADPELESKETRLEDGPLTDSDEEREICFPLGPMDTVILHHHDEAALADPELKSKEAARFEDGTRGDSDDESEICFLPDEAEC
ncbi:expressed unknown protein [Seminavis robusta]|uniref:Uncharacterized protein n=1 Tax=Seminavis robusta TaxID=568900 RepID=A0A9N8ETM7_9STRA|nr:expressed unknown protein [Seminavis robusta]|eukprot:Sro1596_g284830.1 n/a (485) ;mRNA; r:20045-21499